MAEKIRKRYYVRGATVAFEEDDTHEFKGHKNIAVEDVPPFTDSSGKATRKAISRTLNAFLNTGKGGKVYIGVTDDGVVFGVNLNQYQKDHMLTCIDEVLNERYDPPVSRSRYQIKFIPVVEKGSSQEAINSILSYNSKVLVDHESRRRKHVLFTYQKCWCDKEAEAQLHNDIIPPSYVVEIHIKRWDPSDPSNEGKGIGKMNCHPIHGDEEGKVYFRRQASVVQYTLLEIAGLAKHIVEDHYSEKLAKLRGDLRALRS